MKLKTKIQFNSLNLVAEFSGLLDQTIADINTLFEGAKMTSKPVILFASDCLAFLLQPVSVRPGIKLVEIKDKNSIQFLEFLKVFEFVLLRYDGCCLIVYR